MTSLTRSLRTGLAAAFSIGAAFSMSGLAHAQSPAECACLVPLASLPASGPIGQVTGVTGDNVILTGSTGPVQAAAGAPLQSGDQLSVGPGSSVTFAVSNCSLQLPAQTEMSLAPTNGNMCVAVNEVGTTLFGGNNVVPVAVGALGVAGGAALLLSSGTDSPVSP